MSEKINQIKDSRYFGTVFPAALLAAVVLLFGVLTNGRFYAASNIKGIFNQALMVATAAVGVSFIYASGNIDISIGAVTALAAAVGAKIFGATNSVAFMMAVTIGLSAVILSINGNLSIVFHIKPVVVAIVMMLLCNALQGKVLGATDLYVDNAVCIALDKYFRIPAFVVYFLSCIILFHFTKIGRAARFTGGNETCAKQAGIDSSHYLRLCFLIAGIGVGLCALFTISRTGSVSRNTASSLGMDVMLATVLGGMSIFGGYKSNCFAGVFGALVVAALNKGLLMMGVPASAIQGIRGVLFLFMVYASSERTDVLPSKDQV